MWCCPFVTPLQHDSLEEVLWLTAAFLTSKPQQPTAAQGSLSDAVPSGCPLWSALDGCGELELAQVTLVVWLGTSSPAVSTRF